MPAKRFHLGWFMNFVADLWNEPFASGGSPWSGEFYMEMAKTLERACFDYIMVEDKLCVSESMGGTAEIYLKHGLAPKHDPAPLAALMSYATARLGVVITMSTMAYPPFLLARLASTLDHIARGRFGWNIVTSAEDSAAQNLGLDQLPDRQLRYDMADEYMDLVCKLFDSWEPDAVVMDRDKGVYADFRQVHPINFKGKFFKCRGPLNTVRCPQGRPVFVQAGGSPRGREFASRHADSIITLVDGIEGMKFYRDDIRARAEKNGRNPDDIKVLFLVIPTLGSTMEEALAKRDKMASSPAFVEQTLALVSAITDIDFSKFDLDSPVPPLTTNGEQGSLDKFTQFDSGKTLRQLAYESTEFESSIELIGTPDQVADRMGQIIEEVGGDGFLITTHNQRVSRSQIIEVTDGLVPALQRRGLTRTAYTYPTLRENLRDF
jgi:FMN-dependent oxidoreductase (nitrilotriacetate monooxygenase family)